MIFANMRHTGAAAGLVAVALMSCAAPLPEQVGQATLEEFQSTEFKLRLRAGGPESLDALFVRLEAADSPSELEFEVAQSILFVVSHEYEQHVPEATLGITGTTSPTGGIWFDPVPLRAWWRANRVRILAGEPFDLPPNLYDSHGMSFHEWAASQPGGPDPSAEAMPQLGYISE